MLTNNMLSFISSYLRTTATINKRYFKNKRTGVTYTFSEKFDENSGTPPKSQIHPCRTGGVPRCTDKPGSNSGGDPEFLTFLTKN